jgi:hypothetical protein
MSDRYEVLMTRREALVDEAHRRMQAMRDQCFRTAPLASMSWSASGPVLSPDGRLSMTVEEFDEHHRRRGYTLWSEVDGTIRELPAAEEEGAQPPPTPDPRIRAGTPEPGFDEVAALANRYLDPAVAQAWLAFLAPAVRLVHAQAGDPVVAQLGGLSTLPINSWPVWEGHGPLSHVVSIDCASLIRLLPSLDLPDSGRLAFFYFDGHYDDYKSTVGVWDPATQDGARVLWLHPEESTPARLAHVPMPAPPGLTVFPAVALTAVPTLIWPTWEHPELLRIWEANGLPEPRPGVAAPAVEALYDALHDQWYVTPDHQVGGHPFPEQGAVELEIAGLSLRKAGATSIDYSDPAIYEDARGWQLLVQVDTDDDADMMWGDVGKLYFMIRPEDLQARRFDQVSFTWQCG